MKLLGVFAEAAEVAGITQQAVHRALERGSLPFIEIETVVLVRPSAIFKKSGSKARDCSFTVRACR